jgi:hypothetical protein
LFRITLNDTEKAELRQVTRQAVGRVSERAHFVLLSSQGYSAPKIGELFGYEAQTVRSWLQSYQDEGCKGLVDDPRSGRPEKEPFLRTLSYKHRPVNRLLTWGTCKFAGRLHCWFCIWSNAFG